ncbi:hypothetical protein TWF569_007274 [Orbilia oligospora]|nr:hypothetical protein TWF706_010524 [Orbilia oligospora]KAF3143657.1 hypothetical protein TWF569_007274 [Orbilia oligospora]KAF3190064.1 hypothetical protein TWF225_002560 [Orbilia oligospora]KAF3266193.1 hypothetical protein TWF217_001871 [Orbilia oligospora]KAF3268697.1 hypothetical protein TWF128_007069 [Orbilia oligospora]
MPTSVFKPGKVALISGGASGIGRAIANLCLAKGMNVAIVDSNVTATKEFVASSKEKYPSATIDGYQEDASNPRAWSLLKKDFIKRFHRIDFLVLNAAIHTKSDWKDPTSFAKTMDVNYFGYLNGISTFFDEITASTVEDPKVVVLTGSKQGITNPPGNPAYNASKAAIKSIAESLHFDLRDNATTHVHLLVPGWTYTGMTGSAGDKGKPSGAWTAEQVADYLAEKMEKGEFYVICPDNEVNEVTDKKRMAWAAGDVIERRPPLSRWRDDWKEKAAAEIHGA